MSTKCHGGSSAKVGALTLTAWLSAIYGATWATSAFVVAPASPLRLQLQDTPLIEPPRHSSRAPAATGTCLALGVVGVAAAALRRQGRSIRTPRQAEPQQPQPGREPEIDPRRQDPPNTVPPVRMPMVDTGSGEKLDVMSKLLEDRIIILGGEVKDEMAQILVAQMLYLANSDPKADITMYINSPGGSVSAGMAAQLQFGFRHVLSKLVAKSREASAYLIGARYIQAFASPRPKYTSPYSPYCRLVTV